MVAMSIAAAAEVKFVKVEYLPPKVEGQKKTSGKLANFRTKESTGDHSSL
jgi:hypothetical protein